MKRYAALHGKWIANDPRPPAQPYLNGLLHLLPLSKRERGQKVLRETVDTLRCWLVGRLITMAFAIVATGLGLWLLGIPLALVLGIFAGLMGFVPYIGPILAAAPAILLAVPAGQHLGVISDGHLRGRTDHAGLYLSAVDSALDSLAAARPADHLSGRHGVWAGALGVALATPLVVAAMVLVRRLYVEQYLGDASVA